MTKFLVTFKNESGNRSSKQYIPVGFQVEVEANSNAKPHDSEVKKAIIEKLDISDFPYSTSSGLWEAEKI